MNDTTKTGCDAPMTCNCKFCEQAFRCKRSGYSPLSTRMDSLTDDQLRTECERRGLDNEGAEWQARHDMRRLAEHLGIPDGTAEEDAAFVNRQVRFLVEQRDNVTKLRDEWKRRYEHRAGWCEAMDAVMRRFGMPEAVYAPKWLEGELDEWKRRAEAAEALVADEHDEGCNRSLGCTCSRGPAGWKTRALEAEASALKMARRIFTERGPGIDSRPDNSVAWLDEELLCADE